MPALTSDAPPRNAILPCQPAEREFLLDSSRALARGVLLTSRLLEYLSS